MTGKSRLYASEAQRAGHRAVAGRRGGRKLNRVSVVWESLDTFAVCHIFGEGSPIHQTLRTETTVRSGDDA